jgi:transcription termination/antitermination protein NusA
VKTIVRELNGEKIDIIKHYADVKEMTKEALKPAEPKDIILDEKNHRIIVKVIPDQLAVAIGKGGKNVRLTSRLLGWRLEVEELKVVSSDPREVALASMVAALGIDRAMAERLFGIGINSPAAFEGVELNDLQEAGFSEEEAQALLARIVR